jgi:hypothetical protein
MASKEHWLALVDRLYAKGTHVFDQAALESDEGTKDPTVASLALLARSLSNFKAAILLLENDHPVEARVLVRCCYENFFWCAALVKKGAEFVKAVELDHAASRKKRAGRLVNWSKEQGEPPKFLETLEPFLEDLKKEHPKVQLIKFEDAAKDGGIGGAYIFYSELSNDAAHPSATSISRHITWDEGENPHFTVHAHPVVEDDIATDTLELACSAMLGTCVAVNQILGYGADGEKLEDIARDFTALSNSNKAAREAK